MAKTAFSAVCNFGIGFTLTGVDMLNRKTLRLAKKAKEDLDDLEGFVEMFNSHGDENLQISIDLIGNEFDETIKYIITVNWAALQEIEIDGAEELLFKVAEKYGLVYKETKISMVGDVYIY
jgi:hypothetical protein